MRIVSALLLSLNTASCCNVADEVGKRLAEQPTPTPSGSASAAFAPASAPAKGEVPPPATTIPPPFSVGQWATYAVTRSDGSSSSLELKVVGVQAGAHWFEAVTSTKGKPVVVQFLLAARDRRDARTFDLKEAKIRLPNGRVQVLRGVQLAMTRKMLDDMLAKLHIPTFEGAAQEDTTVPAGMFRKCYVNDVKGTYFGMKTDARVWNHPAVPISTMVRSQDRADGSVIVLEAYGTTGAKSAMGS